MPVLLGMLKQTADLQLFLQHQDSFDLGHVVPWLIRNHMRKLLSSSLEWCRGCARRTVGDVPGDIRHALRSDQAAHIGPIWRRVPLLQHGRPMATPALYHELHDCHRRGGMCSTLGLLSTPTLPTPVRLF